MIRVLTDRLTTGVPTHLDLPGGVGRAGAFGVYVHMPFCRRRCDYCAFATWDDRHHLWDRYVEACCKQAAGLAGWERGPATSVYFGGGTPSLLPAELLVRVLEAVKGACGVAPGAEVTIECNPETVTSGKLAAYRAAGVTRLSFGAQSMAPHVLASLGREHDPTSVRRAAELAGEAGFGGNPGTYNVDLIFGAAGEALADWRASLEAVTRLDPPPAHVSAYALTVEPGTPLARHPERHPSEEDQESKYALADSLLTGLGYEWYEISNWARPGAECAHNLLYWRQGEYAGIGCAAHSHRLDLTTGGARRWWNVRTPERYSRLVEAGASAEAAGEDISTADREWEALFLAIRTRWGVRRSAVPDHLLEWGLVAEVAGRAGEPGQAVLTRKGRLLANEVIAHLVPARRGRAGPTRAHARPVGGYARPR
jgi:putative oxygen-independent coproporphyrinogen III oxidase